MSHLSEMTMCETSPVTYVLKVIVDTKMSTYYCVHFKNKYQFVLVQLFTVDYDTQEFPVKD